MTNKTQSEVPCCVSGVDVCTANINQQNATNNNDAETATTADGGGVLSTVPKRSKQRTDLRDCVVRFVRDTQNCSVNGFVFEFIHRLEGKWSGEMHAMRPPRLSRSVEEQQSRTSDVVVSDVIVISTKVSYFPQGYWDLRETTAKSDGAARLFHIMCYPVSHGVCEVQEANDSSEYMESVLTVTEMRPYGLQLAGHNKNSGILTYLQIISMTPTGELERVQMRYDGGELRHTAFSRERRVEQT
eukprot:GHVS01076270.1.p1 GENE.GHVS01076270.1~~GHVS01076270.1.p1  ORF type:complete len:243 (+),score=36.25 GHVS01076270.1:315-1043(+)